MARRDSNTASVIIWFLGLLGCIGYIHPLGFIPLLIPFIFVIFGSKLTQSHARVYLNVLFTSIVFYMLGYLLYKLLGFFGVHVFNLMYVSLVYFALMCIIGLSNALHSRRFRTDFMFRILK